MRLQVTVQRHGLPPTNILWTSSSPFPHHVTADSSATVAQLVEDINDVVPLESREWGLEDYTVEVDGYECLHFHPIESVLKEDDKVTIRALQSSDLRARRYGGRLQVTSDGRHLIDGVPYGRPFIRKSDRPEVPIPSRKRKRSDSEDLMGYNIAGSIWQAAPRYLGSHLISNGPQNPQDADEEEEEDDEFIDEDSTSSSNQEEDSEEESDELEDEARDLRLLTKDVIEETPRLPKRQKISASSQLAIESSTQPLLLEYGQSTGSPSETIQASTSSKTKSVAFEDEADSESETSSKHSTSEDSSVDESGDDSSTRGSSSSSSSNTSRLGSSVSSEETSCDFSESSSSSNSLSSVSRARSSSGSEESSHDLSTSSSVSSLDSDKSSESEDSALDAGSELEQSAKPGKFSQAVEQSVTKENVKPYVSPGQGTKRTKQNNVRQKKRRRLNRLKEAGMLKPEARFQDLDNLDSPENSLSDEPHEADDEELNAKREGLIRMLDEQEIKLDHQLSSENHPTNSVGKARSLSPQNQDQPLRTSFTVVEEREANSEPPKKRSRLDLASSRRLLFGSLGLKVPKSQSAERELREKLANEARHKPNGVSAQKTNSANERPVPEAMHADDWKSKLIISAVECAHEGVSLTAPPFPFVQRWDKDAINTIQNRRGGPKLSEKRRSLSQTWLSRDENDSSQISSEANPANATEDGLEFNKTIQDQLMRDANDISALTPEKDSFSDDLPMPPEDLTSLTDLRLDNAQPGSIFVYRTLEVGENFQPRLSGYRTARVDQISEDGTWEVTPAKRDLKASMLNLTGLQNLDEETEVSTDSLRRLRFLDLVSPKILSTISSSEKQETERGDSDPRMDSDDLQHMATERHGDATASTLLRTSLSHSSETHEPFPKTVSTPRRQQIFDLIREAGFDSSLSSSLRLPEAFKDSTESRVAGQINATDSSITRDDSTSLSAGSKSSVARNDAISQEDVKGIAPQSIPSPHFAGFDSSPRPSEPLLFDEAGQPSQLKLTVEQLETPVVQYPSLPQGSFPSGSRESPENNNDNNIDKEKASGSPNDTPSGTIQERNLPNVDEAYVASLQSTVPPTEDVAPSPAGSRMSNPFRINYSSYDGTYSSDEDLSTSNGIPSSVRDHSPVLSPSPLKVSRRSERWPFRPTKSPKLEETASNDLRLKITNVRSAEDKHSSQIPEGSQVVDLTTPSSPMSLGDSDGEYLVPVSSQRKSGWRPQTNPIRKARGSSKLTGFRKGKGDSGKGSQRKSR